MVLALRLKLAALKRLVKLNKSLSKRLRLALRNTQNASRKSVRAAHHHAAKRPHQYLCNRFQWYDNWHNWDYHKHTHALILGGYLIVVGGLMLGAYHRVQALSDLSQSWNFSDASKFELGGGVEANGTSARLKAQNYTADATTAALFHFDESNGTNATDSSGNNNNATASVGIGWSAGNLNNAASFNGTQDHCTHPTRLPYR